MGTATMNEPKLHPGVSTANTVRHGADMCASNALDIKHMLIAGENRDARSLANVLVEDLETLLAQAKRLASAATRSHERSEPQG